MDTDDPLANQGFECARRKTVLAHHCVLDQHTVMPAAVLNAGPAAKRIGILLGMAYQAIQSASSHCIHA
ncbi:MAG TPA: hypothetical protein PKC22_00285 [Rhodocyclaceae bacterium]|nr:hypothetical protein [Rhodocyclaceae bacterium]